MKKTMLIFMVLTSMAAFGAASSGESNMEQSIDTVVLLDELYQNGLLTIELDVIDYIVKIGNTFSASKFKQFKDVLCALSKQNNSILDQQILTRTLAFIRVNPSITGKSSDLQITSNNIVPSQSTEWGLCKKFFVGFSASLVTVYCGAKAYSYWRSLHK